jgi:hypothetical protein
MIETVFINQININKVVFIVFDFVTSTVAVRGVAAMKREDCTYASSKIREMD